MISFMADVIGIRDDMYIGKVMPTRKKSSMPLPKVIKTEFLNRNRPWSTSSAISTIRPSVWLTQRISFTKWAASKT